VGKNDRSIGEKVFSNLFKREYGYYGKEQLINRKMREYK
jgi:hypothetical protein